MEEELTPLKIEKKSLEQVSRERSMADSQPRKLLHTSSIEPLFVIPNYIQLYEKLHQEIEGFHSEYRSFVAQNDRVYKDLIGAISRVIHTKFPGIMVGSEGPALWCLRQ